MREVVPESRTYSFYGYARLGDFLEPRLLLRLAAFLNPKSVWLAEGSPDFFRKALEAVDSSIRILHTPDSIPKAELVVAAYDDVISGFLRESVAAAGHAMLLFCNPLEADRVADFVCEAMPGGVALCGREYIICVSRDTGPLHRYAI